MYHAIEIFKTDDWDNKWQNYIMHIDFAIVSISAIKSI